MNIFIAPSKQEKQANLKEFLKESFFQKHYLIERKDGKYDYLSNIFLNMLGLISFFNLPYHIHTIHGNFSCSFNQLESVENGPEIVHGYYFCSNNNLKSLKYGPTQVGKNYICNNCKLETLEGCPEIINGVFDCSSNFIQTLKWFPKVIHGNLFIDNNIVKFPKQEIRSICDVKGRIYN